MFNIKTFNKKTSEAKSKRGHGTIICANNHPFSICLEDMQGYKRAMLAIPGNGGGAERNVLCHYS